MLSVSWNAVGIRAAKDRIVCHVTSWMPRLLALLIFLPVLSDGQGGPPLFSVQVGRATQMEVIPSVEFVGSLEPWRTIALSAQVSGAVKESPIQEGQRLEEGALVCQLDTEAIEIEIERARAELHRAQADLSRLRSGFRVEEIEEAQKELDQRKAALVGAKDEWERNRTLAQSGVISEREATRVETLYRQAEAAVASAEANLRKLTRGYRKEEVDAAQAEVEIQTAALRDAERRHRHHTILAPVNSAVVERLKEPGEWVQVGDAVARLVVLDPLKVRIDVPQRFLAGVRPGQVASIEVDGMPNLRLKATVDQIVPRAQSSTRNFPVLMRLENPYGDLSSGLFARVRLELGQAKPMIVVPREAVLVRGDALTVLVADPLPAAAMGSNTPAQTAPGAGSPAGGPPLAPNAVIREVAVRTSTEIGDLVAVETLGSEILRDGDQVVVLGGTRLSSGMPVRVMEPLPAGQPSAAQQQTAGAPQEATRDVP